MVATNAVTAVAKKGSFGIIFRPSKYSRYSAAAQKIKINAWCFFFVIKDSIVARKKKSRRSQEVKKNREQEVNIYPTVVLTAAANIYY